MTSLATWPTFRPARWVFALAVVCRASVAGVEDFGLEQLHHTSWTSREGSPTGILHMVQTTDGFIWLSAPSGLYRFDGVHFELFEPRSGQPRLKSNPLALLAVPDNGLWVSFAYGGVSFLHNGAVTNYDEKDGLPVNGVYQFVKDGTGVIWAVTEVHSAALQPFGRKLVLR